MRTLSKASLISLALANLASLSGCATTANTATGQPARQAAVASAHPLATAAGIKALRDGGNAFDAAVAVTSTLAVVQPTGSGLGGGGFWLLYIAKEDRYVMVDGREKAPLQATPDMYLNREQEVIPGLSVNGPLAAGIPGEPAAMAHLQQKYGQLSLKANLADAITHATNGFPLDHILQKSVKRRRAAIIQSPAMADVFLRNNRTPAVGTVIKQPDLATTLQHLSDNGHAGFYTGPVAQKLVTGTQQGGGIWTLADFAQYQIVEREPVIGQWRGHKIVAASLPSSGGIVMMQTFNTLTALENGQNTGQPKPHHLVEAWRHAYHDRAEHMGDTDFVSVPVDTLLSQQYAATKAAQITDRATPSSSLKKVTIDNSEGTNTTHFSIIDSQGNRVSATLSINRSLGAAWMAPGTGVILNDEMDDFVIKPGVPNTYGLVGNSQNAIQPGKRMLSSMTPTLVESKDGQGLIIGTPGGSRIITMVMQGIIQYEQGATAEQIVAAPRMHHQYLPDKVFYEKMPGEATLHEALAPLANTGHSLVPYNRRWGNMQVIKYKGTASQGASDPRGIGSASTILLPTLLMDDGGSAGGWTSYPPLVPQTGDALPTTQ